jgi:hypothetical protein
MKIIRSKEFTAERSWGALDIDLLPTSRTKVMNR